MMNSIIQTSSSLKKYMTQSTFSCSVILLFAIFVEILSTYTTKVASDTSSPYMLLFSLGMYLVSTILFALSLAKISVGKAYAIWSALGTAAVSALGIVFFGEELSFGKIICLAMVIGGVVGLNMLDDAGEKSAESRV
uniref:EamA domain-containing protein n=1 Tax=Ditylum brightwellii TaxID=49249 RepID=A0A7S4QWE1_9STRA|mmetsp:Transcript_29860/g.45051  ORF Transcript_29860/g.45051 Transcript_29860/m.45051 type:complete len:137 (-) Transcript_29860:119-529(-)